MERWNDARRINEKIFSLPNIPVFHYSKDDSIVPFVTKGDIYASDFC
jgi:hypothetical protein